MKWIRSLFSGSRLEVPPSEKVRMMGGITQRQINRTVRISDELPDGCVSRTNHIVEDSKLIISLNVLWQHERDENPVFSHGGLFRFDYPSSETPCQLAVEGEGLFE